MQSQKLAIGSLLLLAFIFIGCNSTAKLDANKEVINRFTEVMNNQEWDGLDDLVLPNFVRHSDATIGPQVKSLEDFKNLQKEFLKSVPNQKVTIEKLVAEGDYVAALATYSGTQDGPMPPFPPSGKEFASKFIGMFRFEKGKIAELWVEWDNLALLMQLGHFPPPEQGEK